MKNILIFSGILIIGILIGNLLPFELPKLKLSITKASLESNKIIAEWITFTFSILTSLAALYIAKKAKDVTENQNRITKLQKSPRFDFVTELVKGEVGSSYDKNILIIKNLNPDGFLIENEFRHISYIEVMVGKTKLTLPILQYYYLISGKINNSDYKQLIPDRDNNKHLVSLTNKLSSTYSKKMNPQLCMKTYVHIKYEDFYRELIDDYYEIEYGTFKNVSKEEFEIKYDLTNAVDFYDVDMEFIKKKIEELNNI
jgi:hypothetical protein